MPFNAMPTSRRNAGRIYDFSKLRGQRWEPVYAGPFSTGRHAERGERVKMESLRLRDASRCPTLANAKTPSVSPNSEDEKTPYDQSSKQGRSNTASSICSRDRERRVSLKTPHLGSYHADYPMCKPTLNQAWNGLRSLTRLDLY